MIEKECIKCGECKPLDKFHRNSNMADGRLGKCKACAKSYSANYRAKNIERYREYTRSENTKGYRLDYRKRYPKKRRAHHLARYAVKTGRLKSPDRCEGPGCAATSRLDKHHPDYSKPLDVEWYCPACHHSGNHKKIKDRATSLFLPRT